LCSRGVGETERVLEKKEAAAELRPKSREETPKEGYQTGNQIRAV